MMVDLLKNNVAINCTFTNDDEWIFLGELKEGEGLKSLEGVPESSNMKKSKDGPCLVSSAFIRDYRCCKEKIHKLLSHDKLYVD